MSLIYLAGPLDYGTNDSSDRQEFLKRASDLCVIYDATSVFAAPPVQDMATGDMAGAIEIHHAAIKQADVMVADMRMRSVGIPIEMWVAYNSTIPIVTLYDDFLPKSLYLEHMTDHWCYSWDSVLSKVMDYV